MDTFILITLFILCILVSVQIIYSYISFNSVTCPDCPTCPEIEINDQIPSNEYLTLYLKKNYIDIINDNLDSINYIKTNVIFSDNYVVNYQLDSESYINKIKNEFGFKCDLNNLNALEKKLKDTQKLSLNKNDKIFNIKPTPNRADCFSVRGIARDLSAMSNSITFKYPTNLKPENMAKNQVEGQSHTIAGVCSNFCHAFASIVITGVNNQGSSPEWLVNKLNKFGQKSISPLVDISNY